VLPLVWIRSALFGRFLVSMPWLDSGGPIAAAEAPGAIDALTDAARHVARRGRAHLMELRSRDHHAVAGLSVSERKLTVTLPLPADAEALFKSLPSKVRSQVRRPLNAGCTVRFGPEQRAPFHAVYARHMRDLGSPAQGPRLFEAVARSMPDHVEFAVVYDAAGQPVASGCGFAFRGEFALVWAAALRRASAEAPNMLLYWSLMERAIERRLRMFDFGRCTPGSGTHRFKRQWGGTDVPLRWLQWSVNGRTAPPQARDARFRLAGAVWRRLPLGFTNACGPRVARLIP